MRARLALLPALCAALLLAGCPPIQPFESPDSGSPETVCPVTLTYRPRSSASRVGLIGQWDEFDRLAHVMRDSDGDGTYSVVLRVPPGRWSYAFLENGQEMTDPEARYLLHREGRALSALHVPDCRLPSIAVQRETVFRSRTAPGTGEFRITLTISGGEGSSAAPPLMGTLRSTSVPERPLTAEELTVVGDGSAMIKLTGLADGKYTVSVRAGGQPLLLPFWIEPELFSYRDSPVYMLVTDRFRDGDPSNNVPPNPSIPFSARFQGGDFQGVAQSIREGYFDGLGLKAIWLTPWQTQPLGSYLSDDGRPVSGYHGYWPVKAREVDERFGGAQGLKDLVAEAHKHGIRILMDGVMNHVHQDHEYFQDPARKRWFRTGCKCGSSDACGWENARLTCLFTDYMPDVNWTHDEASAQLIADTLWWLEEYDLDGLRLDAVKHIENSAFTNLTSAVRDRFEQAGTEYYMFGESFTGDSGLIKSYMGPRGLDGQLNFPLFFDVPEPVFARDERGLQQVRDATHGTVGPQGAFGDAMMVNFVGNHDVARFITKADPANRDRQGSKWEGLPGAPVGQVPYDRLFLAMANVMTIPGVPLVYYGDEYGEFGGSDPDNRHMLNREPTYFPEQRNQLNRMKALLTARAQLRGLRRGPLVDLWVNEEPWGPNSRGNLYAYARPDSAGDPRQSAVVVLNLTANTWTGVVVNFPASLTWTAGLVREALSGRELGFSNSTVTVDVPARGAVILHLK